MTVEEARKNKVCRVCGKPISFPSGQPKGWGIEFGEMIHPEAVTLNFGDEFAHTNCLKPEERYGG